MADTECLIEKLKTLEAIPGMEAFSQQYLGDGDRASYPTAALPLMASIVDMAEGVLIDDSCRPHTENIAALAKAGFRVSPGEKDRFGWLTGVIITKVGKIVFG